MLAHNGNGDNFVKENVTPLPTTNSWPGLSDK